MPNLIPNFKGKRWLKVILRALHLLGLTGVAISLATENFDVYSWTISILSGLGLLALEALSNLLWFVQVRALAIYIKFALLFVLFWLPEYGLYCLIGIVFLSAIISHAPGSVRYYSVVHRKLIRSANDIKG